MAPNGWREIAPHPRTIRQGEGRSHDEHAVRRIKRARYRAGPDGSLVLALGALLIQPEFPNWKLVEVVQSKFVNLLSGAHALAHRCFAFRFGLLVAETADV